MTKAPPNIDPGNGAALVEAYLHQISQRAVYDVDFEISDLEPGRRILQSPIDVQVAVLVHVFQHTRLGAGSDPHFLTKYLGLRRLATALLRRQLPLSESHLLVMLERIVESSFGEFSAPGVLRAIQNFLKSNPMSAALSAALHRARASLSTMHQGLAPDRSVSERIDELLGLAPPRPEVPIKLGDSWTNQAISDLDWMPPAERGAWVALLQHCSTATGSRPSTRWLRSAESLIQSVGTGAFASRCAAWLEHVGRPGATYVAYHEQAHGDATLLDADNADVLKGLVWGASLVESPLLLRAVAAAGESAFTKLPNIGPRCVKLGNACLQFLSAIDGDEPVAELLRLRARTKHPSIRKQIDAALSRAASRRGQTPEDLVELAVPTFGLMFPGVLRRTIGGFEAELSIAGTAETQLRWKSPQGKSVRSTPKAVRDTDPAAARELAGLRRQIERLLPAQRDRLERLLLSQRSWSSRDWRARFVDHPLLANLAGRLIWRFTRGDRCELAMKRDDGFVGPGGKQIEEPGESSRVSLWHPITSGVEEVVAWRQTIESLGIRQPFKQAHREVYLLTDAERRTETYSNRFAAHFLRQHQMAALCRERGWSYRLAGGFDNGGAVPTLTLPSLDLVAEYWVEPILEPDAMSGHDISLFVATDQVRFRRSGAFDPIPVADIPPAVFSEVMRDVDLFVGVCSVGNDPLWSDGGPSGAYRDYWHTFSFGDLSETGRARAEVLSRIVPRLSIAPRCSLSDRFLVVRGNLHTYRIHLGSGNILMEPNGQYLCIVPGSHNRSDGPVSPVAFLPFEGDRTLSIILSKAFMLAEDDKIADESITRQIKG